MSSNGPSKSRDGLQLAKALLLLDELVTADSEAVVSDHLRVLLEDAQRDFADAEQRFSALLRTMLDALAHRVSARDPVLEKQIRMVALRLTPPITAAELAALEEYIAIILKRTNVVSAVAQVLPPVNLPVPEFVPPPIAPPPAAAPPKSPGPAAEVAPQMTGPTQYPPETPAAVRSEALVREHVAQRGQEINKVRAALVRHVDEAIAQNQEFGVLLSVELEALRQAERIQDIEKRRVTLIAEINKFVKKHRMLSDKFDSASKYLRLVESSNQQLSDELDRVRLLSLTDELTGLPNRRAFLRRLEDEVGRVKRYGVPVTMTIIDLDDFKGINDNRGHGGGDAVLRGYSDHILSIFRHHDMVARYGGEEFAVILPNTSGDGAMRALQKVQKRVSETFCNYNGERFPMPTFSAGLAEYRPGETLSEFIERADSALYRAKNLGRNRVETASDLAEVRDPKKDLRDDVSARQA
jgi:diguanylate cyclase (GGDEF)-like protein